VPNGGGPSSRLEIRLLGPFDARLGSQPLPRARTRKGQHLLALLALRSPREVQREWLAANLWPDSYLENGYYNLRRELSSLRAALGGARDLITAPSPHSLRLEMGTSILVDAHRFDLLVQQGDPASLQEAVDLYRGPLLEGWTEEWIEADREARHQTCLRALDSLAAGAVGRQEWPEAVRWLKRLTALEPLQDDLQRRLIEALARKGDAAAAVMAYREYRERLHREMNATPSPETTTLFREVQAEAGRSVSARRPSAVRKEPEALNGYLPPLLTSFVGRRQELEEIGTLLKSFRMVTIVGAGGIGKTRLAIRAAERSAREFPDGVWFVDLAPVVEESRIVPALARVLGVGEEAGTPLLETVLGFLAEKRLLLVLDNCEHLCARSGEIAGSLLEACPGIRLLATSRQPLETAGERVWAAPPMSLPEVRHLPKAGEGLAFVLPQFEAVRLFVERAAESMAAFALTEENAPAALRIVRRLDGLPLAIELAAARVRALSVEQVAARLDNRFRLLTRGNAPAPRRHQTLGAAIDWSYDLLTEAERTVFLRLAVFAAGWTLDAAEAVCADEAPSSTGIHAVQILDLLTDLIEKSLVVADVEAAGDRRYRMLESIREYALSRLAEYGLEGEARSRHAAYYLSVAEAGDPHKGGELSSQRLKALEADHDNFRAALQHLSGEDLLRIVKSLFWFWNVRGHWSEGRACLEEALAGYSHADALRAAALNGLGILAWRQGDYGTARCALEEGIAIHRSLGERGSMGSMLGNLGLVLCDLGDYPAARACHAEALEIDRELGHQNVAARLCNLGLVEMYENELAAALGHFDEAIVLFRENDHQRGVATSLANRGLIALRLGDYRSAARDNMEAAAICRELSLKGILGFALHGLGMTAFYENDYSQARAYYLESLKIRQEVADQKGITDSFNNIGDLLLRCGEPYRAAVIWGAADRLRAKIGAALSGFEKFDYDANLAECRAALGNAEFETAWAEGRVVSIERVVAELAACGPGQ
jgi:predicted ATPase/DNA-binding SARP family transcriptional activator